MSGDDIITLLNLFGARLPGALAFSLGRQGSVPADHPLAGEIVPALDGKAASLPYDRGHDVLWVTLAPTAEELRQVIEDLRCWVLPSYGWEAIPSIVSAGSGVGQMGALLLQQSPQGYFRWHSRPGDTDFVIARLATMRSVIEQAPLRRAQLRPTLEMLRRQFTLGLATGDRDAALKAIDEIDQHQLDTASNALSMRIRLAAALGDDQAIVEHPQLDDLLSMRVPQRIIECVLLAHHTVYLAELEAAGNIEGALAAYLPISDRLAGLASNPVDDTNPTIVRMAAYDAAFAEDVPRLQMLAARFPIDAVIAALAVKLPAGALPSGPAVAGLPADEATPLETIARPDAKPDALPASELEVSPTAPPVLELAVPPVRTGAQGSIPGAATSEPALPLDWSDVPSLVATGAREPLAAFLEHAALMPDSCDPGNGDFVLELFTDTSITDDPKKLAEADRVLTIVIDAYVCEERFPRRERLTLYQAVMDTWSSIRTYSTDPIDGQLLLTMVDALLRLDGKFEPSAAIAITRWWEARPIRSRLAWLGEALELLSEQSVSQDYLALWFVGAGLIKVDHDGLSFADRHLWGRLGRRFGLDAATTDEALGGKWQTLEAANDRLSACGFKKIAIVSLHERAAREAALQIEQRTRTNVLVVTDHSAGEGTASAATADVILFVWGATKHAVYRAFDKVRDRLEYVQGTGSASIVRALERRVLGGVPD